MPLAASVLGLRNVRLFDELDAAALEDIARHCRWQRLRAGQRMAAGHSGSAELTFIVAGRLMITAYSGEGRQLTYREVERGEWFGELAAVDARSRTADIEACEESLIAAVSAAYFTTLMDQYASVRRRVLEGLAGLVRELADRVFDLGTLSVQDRLHGEVLRLALAAGVHGNEAVIEPAPGHAALASRIGTYREQVTREITAMVRAGLLERRPRGWRVPDVERLRRQVAAARGMDTAPARSLTPACPARVRSGARVAA